MVAKRRRGKRKVAVNRCRLTVDVGMKKSPMGPIVLVHSAGSFQSIFAEKPLRRPVAKKQNKLRHRLSLSEENIAEPGRADGLVRFCGRSEGHFSRGEPPGRRAKPP